MESASRLVRRITFRESLSMSVPLEGEIRQHGTQQDAAAEAALNAPRIFGFLRLYGGVKCRVESFGSRPTASALRIERTLMVRFRIWSSRPSTDASNASSK